MLSNAPIQANFPTISLAAASFGNKASEPRNMFMTSLATLHELIRSRRGTQDAKISLV